MSDMGNRIRELRKNNHMTQQELADKLGLQKSAIAKYENGRVSNIKRDIIEIMANLFDVSPGYLLGLEESEHHYIDEKTRQIAQEIADNKELGLLFDAARTAAPEDLKTTHDMLLALKRKEHSEDELC